MAIKDEVDFTSKELRVFWEKEGMSMFNKPTQLG